MNNGIFFLCTKLFIEKNGENNGQLNIKDQLYSELSSEVYIINDGKDFFMSCLLR